MKKRNDGENYLTKIPVLGYFFRKIREHRQAIKTALKTGKETKEDIKKKTFLLGIFKISSRKSFKTLNLEKQKNGKEKK